MLKKSSTEKFKRKYHYIVIMKATSYLFYPVNKQSVKSITFEILSYEWPLSVNELHRRVKDYTKLNLSYQAVHKAVRQLYKLGILDVENNKYAINHNWINELSNIIERVNINYSKTNINTKNLYEKKTIFGIITIKDNNLSDVFKDKQVNNALKELVPAFKGVYKTHNIFEKDEEFIINYLKEVQKEREIIAFTRNGKISGGVVLMKKDEDKKNNYIRWKLRHFACNFNLPLKDRLEFIKNIEKYIIKKGSKNMSVEYNMAEAELEDIKLFRKAGYKRAATLDDRYRLGEKAYTYTKYINL